MRTFYIVHRPDVGKIPKQNQSIVCATWIADDENDIPTMANLRMWHTQTGAAFPADMVDETGTLILRDERFP